MHREIYSKNIEYRRLFALGTVAIVGMLLVFPVRLFLADVSFSRISSILDDKTTEELDRMDLSAESEAAYREATASLETASELVPSKAFYRKALANMYFQSARWSKAMEAMSALPAGGISSSRAGMELATDHLGRAVALDPMNPDYHLALAQMYRERGDASDKADRELQLAVRLYPVSAGLRYAVAMEYLLHSQMDRALDQARVLARIDEGYRIDDSEPAYLLAREKRSAWYLSHLTESFLFKSLEIAWRASGKNAATVAATVPDNVDAQEAARLFFEVKGIDYDGMRAEQK